MTKDEILAMEAGDEMNALIAELMGWTRHEQPFISKWGKMYEWRPPEDSSYDAFLAPHDWSTNIAAAWEVVEKLTPFKFGFNLAIESPPGPCGDWEVHFYNGGAHLAFADTAPLAICRAALLAVMETE